ncbi:MAG: restriction endonuclease subunit R [Spirulina sp.]
MTALQARKLTLSDVRRLFGFQDLYDGSFESLLSLNPVTENEQQELRKIRNNFLPYLDTGEALEGQIRLVAVAPLLRLAGFYEYPIQMKVETNIERIEIETESTSISGRIDIIAVNKDKKTPKNTDFWIVVLETKPSLTSTLAGLPQLLTYAYKGLEEQNSVWGLSTNGIDYWFLYIQQGNPPTYQYMPSLSLLDLQSASKLLQVLKAIAIF